MELNVNIDPEEINKTISEAIAKSAIGEELEKVINKEVERLSASYDNPIENVVRSEINALIQKIVREKYMPMVEETVRENLTEKFTSDLLNKLWENFARSF